MRRMQRTQAMKDSNHGRLTEIKEEKALLHMTACVFPLSSLPFFYASDTLWFEQESKARNRALLSPRLSAMRHHGQTA